MLRLAPVGANADNASPSIVIQSINLGTLRKWSWAGLEPRQN
jgi:hypothetical protein